MWAPSLPFKCADNTIIDVTWEIFFKGAKYTTRANHRQLVPMENECYRYSHGGRIIVIEPLFPLIDAQHVRSMCMLHKLLMDPSNRITLSAHTKQDRPNL